MTIDDFYYEYDDSYDSNNFNCEDNLATCACSQLFTYNDVFYNFMDCYIDRENKTVKVGDICEDTCHLNGCSNEILPHINTYKWTAVTLIVVYNVWFFGHILHYIFNYWWPRWSWTSYKFEQGKLADESREDVP